MTNNYDLGKIETVELRKIWPHEALDFTKWLAEDENLQLLGDTIGTELELIEVESSVGSFNVDIFANEVGTSRKVIIENQLEDTNHDHLGKIITYASGKDAEIIVWIVARARDEHRQAIEWLNQHTDNNFGFFLIEIQLWKIGDSKAAPRFHIVEQPNEWTKMVKLSAELTETERAKLSYWTQYNEIAKCNPEFMQLFSPQKPSKDHWTTLRCGTSDYHISLLIDTQKKCIGIEFYVPDNKEIGHRAIAVKEQFEECLCLEARPFGAKKASGLRFYKSGYDIKGNPEKWPEYIEEQIKWAILMRNLINSLNL